jgi:hypothetical protein
MIKPADRQEEKKQWIYLNRNLRKTKTLLGGGEEK